MNETNNSTSPPRSFRIIGVVALLWNLLGVVSYLIHVTTGEDALAAMPAAERLLYEQMPAWATGAFALAVFTGVIGALGLLLRKSWALPVFVFSLIAILVQDVYWLLLSDAFGVYGTEAIVMPLLVIAIAVLEIWYARRANQRGWLR